MKYHDWVTSLGRNMVIITVHKDAWGWLHVDERLDYTGDSQVFIQSQQGIEDFWSDVIRWSGDDSIVAIELDLWENMVAYGHAL